MLYIYKACNFVFCNLYAVIHEKEQSKRIVVYTVHYCMSPMGCIFRMPFGKRVRPVYRQGVGPVERPPTPNPVRIVFKVHIFLS